MAAGTCLCGSVMAGMREARPKRPRCRCRATGFPPRKTSPRSVDSAAFYDASGPRAAHRQTARSFPAPRGVRAAKCASRRAGYSPFNTIRHILRRDSVTPCTSDARVWGCLPARRARPWFWHGSGVFRGRRGRGSGTVLACFADGAAVVLARFWRVSRTARPWFWHGSGVFRGRRGLWEPLDYPIQIARGRISLERFCGRDCLVQNWNARIPQCLGC